MHPRKSSIASLFVVAAILLVVTIAGTYAVGLLAIWSNRKVMEARTVLQHLDQLATALQQTQTAQREYLLIGTEGALRVYRQSVSLLRADEGRLRMMAQSGELPSIEVDKIARLSQERTTELEQAIQVRRDSDLAPALSLVHGEEGRGTLQRLKASLARLTAVQQARVDAASQRAWLTETWRTTIFSVTVVANLAFLVWAYRRIVHEVRLREAAALETSRQKELLGTTLASIDDGVIACDRDRRLTFLNREAERLTGWTNQQASGQPLNFVFRVLDEETNEPVVAPPDYPFQEATVRSSPADLILVKREGGLVPIAYSAAPIRESDGGHGGLVVVFRDVTEQRHSETARAHLAAIVQSSGDAIISDDLDGLIQSWNAAAERMFGYSPDQALGQPSSMLIPPDRLAHDKKVRERIWNGQPAEQFESVRVAQGGRRIPVLVTVSPLRDSSGRIIGASRITRDISELVQARETLARGTHELERLVAARTAKLREMVNELQHISYAITHDMRAPLRAIGAFAQMLLEECEASGAPQGSVDYCHRIITAAGRLDTLIRDALSFTGTVLQELPLQPVDLFPLIRGIIDTYPNLHTHAGDVQVEGELHTVLGNESLLTQCFSNLLGNAVKFVPPGVRPQVRVWAEAEPATVRIWVEDNGIGIASHAQSRLFSMFQKLDNRYEGTGVGLAIVRKVTQHMGGKVGVESEPGQGSRFWVELRRAVTVNTH